MNYYWETQPIGTRLIKIFTENGQKTSKAPSKIFFYYRDKLKDENPDALDLDLSRLALKQIDKVMRRNPYELATLGQRISIRLIDSRITQLPVDDPWYCPLDSLRRLKLIIEMTLKQAWNHGSNLIRLNSFTKSVYYGFVPSLAQSIGMDDAIKHYKKWFSLIRYSANSPFKVIDKIGGNENRYVIGLDYLSISHNLANYLKWQILDKSRHRIKKDVLQDVFSDMKERSDIDLDIDQRNAVFGILRSPLSLVLGYAGTGKTTLMRAVVMYLQKIHKNVWLTAISGKACQNLLEKSGLNNSNRAFTVRKLEIMYHNKCDAKQFKNIDYLIVDEISMVNEQDLVALLKLLPRKAHLILIGDRAQLPAVNGVGILTNMEVWKKLDDAYSKNHRFFKCELTKVYRQSSNDLLAAATNVRNGICPQIVRNRDLDDSLVYFKNPVSIDVAIERIYPWMKQRYCLSDKDITVISPVNKSVNAFNAQLQANIIGQKKGLEYHGYCFSKGDRVLVTKNMYGVDALGIGPVNIFNGLVGVVAACYISSHILNVKPGDVLAGYPHLIVHFDKRDGAVDSVDVPFGQLSKHDNYQFNHQYDVSYAKLRHLSLGYALTIHKAQGTTLNSVLFYISVNTDRKMLTRELLYTALTRAHKRVVFAFGGINMKGDEALSYVFHMCMKRSVYDNRNTYLATCIDGDYDRPKDKITSAQRRRIKQKREEDLKWQALEDEVDEFMNSDTPLL